MRKGLEWTLRPRQRRVLGRHKARSQGPHLLEPGGLLGHLHLGCQATADPAPHPRPGAGPARTALGLPWWPEGNITGCWDGLSQGVGLAVPTPTPGESAWKAQQGPGQQALRPENRRPLSPGGFLLPQGRLLGPAHPLLWPRKGSGAASELHAGGFLGEPPGPPQRSHLREPCYARELPPALAAALTSASQAEGPGGTCRTGVGRLSRPHF